MEGQWEALMGELDVKLDGAPLAIYLPARLPSASEADAEMLKLLWERVGARGIPIMPG
jgi:hypothetical protein